MCIYKNLAAIVIEIKLTILIIIITTMVQYFTLVNFVKFIN